MRGVLVCMVHALCTPIVPAEVDRRVHPSTSSRRVSTADAWNSPDFEVQRNAGAVDDRLYVCYTAHRRTADIGMTRTRATANSEGDICRTDRGEQGMKRKVFKECDRRRARSCEDSRKGSIANLQTRQNTDKVVRTCRGKMEESER